MLYNDDCYNIIPSLVSVNACILDPPYLLSSAGPGEKHYGMSLGKFDTDAYKSIVSGFDLVLFDLLEKICQPFNMFCFCSNKQISKIMAYHEAKGRITTLCVWHKVNAAPFANGVWRGDIEYIVHARDSGAIFQGNAEEKKKVFQYPIVNDPDHPTVKPLGLIQRLVKICSLEGQTILDPMAGMFTTGVACAMMGRQFIGIEQSKEYFDKGVKRLEDAKRQDQLIPYKPMTQDSLIS